MSIRVISFDLDGTLVDHHFADSVWHEGMAELYAKRYNVDSNEAKERLLSLYREVGESSLLWYDLTYWFKRLDLPGSPQELLERFRNRVRVFPEVHEVLKSLKEKSAFKLVLFSNAAREFMEIELQEGKLQEYFSLTISCVSDWGRVKDENAYKRLSFVLGVPPKEILHVGDNELFDFLYPKAVGIKTILIDRQNGRLGSVKNLKELLEILR